MTARQRSVVLAGTVSLENYENFRFEFAIEGIETPEDAVDEAIFAGKCLLAIANRSDVIAGQMIRDYVGRVFGLRIEPAPEAPRQVDPAIYESKAPKAPYLPPKGVPAGGAPKPAPVRSKEPEPAKPPAPLTARCSKCGEGIPESQKKMSELFAGKALCKKCHNEVSA